MARSRKKMSGSKGKGALTKEIRDSIFVYPSSIGISASSGSRLDETVNFLSSQEIESASQEMESTGPKGAKRKMSMEEILARTRSLSDPPPQMDAGQQISHQLNESKLPVDPFLDVGRDVVQQNENLSVADHIDEGKQYETSQGKVMDLDNKVDDLKILDRKEQGIKKSFVSLFLDNRKAGSGLALNFVPSSQKTMVTFNEDECNEGKNLWKFALIGHVIGMNVRFKAMESFVTKLWGKISIPKVFLLKPGIFLFDFQHESNMREILEAGPWFFGARPLVLKPWTIDTDIEKIQDQKYPIWVQFPNLRLNLWSSIGISKVASLIGCPITTDKLTATRQRLSYARVLLEVDLPLKEPLPDMVEIQGPNGNSYCQKVIYEFKPRKNIARKVCVPVRKPDPVVGLAKATDKHAQLEKCAQIAGSEQEHVNMAGSASFTGKCVLYGKHAQNDSGIVQEGCSKERLKQKANSPTVNISGFTTVTRASGAKRNKTSWRELQTIGNTVAKDWKWLSNIHMANKARIWILWDSDILSVQEVKTSDQYITCDVKSKDGKLSCLITAVYALNHSDGRKVLWEDLLSFKMNVDCPWLVGGDFNAITSSDEKIRGAPVTNTDTDDFQSFVAASKLAHIKTTGYFFTWGNKQNADTRVWSRLDRTLVNEDWILNYTTSRVEYLMPLYSNHSPGLITIGDDNFEGKKPFKFFNMWTKHPKFLEVVRSAWSFNVRGYNMYKFYSKLKNLKPLLKELNKKNFMDISQQVQRAKAELWDVQEQLNSDLFNPVLISKEKFCISNYTKLLEFMKSKRHQNRVLSLYTENGTRLTDMSEITAEFVQYFKKLLGNAKGTIATDPNIISNGPILNSAQQRDLSSPVSRDEIKQALFLIADSKAPGPDGFNAVFFKLGCMEYYQ
ncbi:uncharacterized protein LOC109841815 [Asparagus officinalis]|uniref:uncharacterized protein LOC109841815 n=1 Tax=Asparagus officinalis TaxID=4686 RepID=UPI00098DE4C5|nr:uncharacterized protein LOC109841815 [Asparagus officinalis]